MKRNHPPHRELDSWAQDDSGQLWQPCQRLEVGHLACWRKGGYMLVDFKWEQPPVMSHTLRGALRLARVGKNALPPHICCQWMPVYQSPKARGQGWGNRVNCQLQIWIRNVLDVFMKIYFKALTVDVDLVLNDTNYSSVSISYLATQCLLKWPVRSEVTYFTDE